MANRLNIYNSRNLINVLEWDRRTVSESLSTTVEI